MRRSWLRPTGKRKNQRASGKRQLRVECLERRELLTTSLGLIPGVTDSPNARLVAGLYVDLLHRLPAASEVSNWLGTPYVQNGQVAGLVTSSPEYRANFITDDYETLLSREPSTSEVAAWLQDLATGLPEKQVTAMFLGSGEYFNDQGGTNTGWLTAVYQNVLNRAPDAAGLAGWNSALIAGMARWQAALSIFNSSEANTVTVISAYRTVLGREPSAAELPDWVAAMNQGLAPSGLLASFASSSEFVNSQVTGLAVLPAAALLSGPTGWHFDFGTTVSPVATGYTGTSLLTFTSATGYGWASTSGLTARDRGTTNPLTRDFVSGSDGTFLVNLANGSYTVTVTLGDAKALRDQESIYAQGQLVASGLTTQAGEFLSKSFTVQVANGQLAIRVVDMGGETKNFAVDAIDIVPASARALLEDFSSLRNNGLGTPLWAPYLGTNPNQTGSLDTSRQAYQLNVSAPNTGADYAYLHFFPNDNGYPWPNGYAQALVKSGTFDPNANRLSFWVMSDHNVTRRSDGGDILEIGTYIRQHNYSDPIWQGQHYYHELDPNLYAGQWTLITINRVPQHRVASDTSINWPEDPEWVNPTGGAPVHYFDGLTRFYFTGLYTSTWIGSYWFKDFEFSTMTGEPDTLVSSVTATYNGTGYELTWAGPKNVVQAYDIAYSTTSMKQSGFASGTFAGTVSDTGNAYTGCFWQSQPMAQQSGIYFAIRPQGQSAFTEIYLPAPVLSSTVTTPASIASLISSVTATYNGTGYQVSWSGPVSQAYDIAYSSTSMQHAGFASGNSAGTVSNTGGTAYFWQSQPMAEWSVIFLAIRPQGQSAFTEIWLTDLPPF
jgi:hypothetical protein